MFTSKVVLLTKLLNHAFCESLISNFAFSDIANILQSLHLIQKVQITESHGARKPAFEYIGPNVKGLGKL